MTETKLCKDCKHFRSPLAGRVLTFWRPNEFARCAAVPSPIDRATELVDGRPPRNAFCGTAREYKHLCGHDAKLFEPKADKEAA